VPIKPARNLSFLGEEEEMGERDKGKGLKKGMLGAGI
jgi:hypothetical protein